MNKRTVNYCIKLINAEVNRLKEESEMCLSYSKDANYDTVWWINQKYKADKKVALAISHKAKLVQYVK